MGKRKGIDRVDMIRIYEGAGAGRTNSDCFAGLSNVAILVKQEVATSSRIRAEI